MLFILQLIIAASIFTGSYLLVSDANKIFIFHMIAICLLAVNLRFMLLYILQGTNRIKEYAQITMMDRILYCVIIVVFLLFGFRDYKLMIVADLIGKLASSLMQCIAAGILYFVKFILSILLGARLQRI